jgi:hypothetical protein
MRNAPNLKVEKYRVTDGPLASDESYGNNGCFLIPYGQTKFVRGVLLNVIISDQLSWDHVSVSVYGGTRRTPSWEEMDFVYGLFFRDDEWAWQYHPPDKDNINNHNHVLHIWRLQGFDIPQPPPMMVGIKETA